MSNDPFGPEAHRQHKHKGVNGHYCCEWDGLWICEECPEFDCCCCFDDVPGVRERKLERAANRPDVNLEDFEL